MWTTDFEGILRISTWLLGIIAFGIYYIRSYPQDGVLNFTSAYVAQTIMLPVFLMLPFLYDPQQMQTTGKMYFSILPFINQAYWLTMLGIVFMLVGYLAASTNTGGKDMVTGGLERIKDSMLSFWQTPTGVWLSFISLAILTVVVIKITGVGLFQGRKAVFEAVQFRPLMNLYAVLISILSLNVLVAAARQKSWSLGIIGLACCGCGLVVGTRGASILIFFQFLIMMAIATRYRRFSTFMVVVPLFVLVAIVIGIMRSESGFDGLESGMFDTVIAQILYGNNFSDLRDYAWILSGFDGVYYYGKTYLAGFLAFVPSYISDFRTTFAIGRITPMLAGLDPSVHAGLRPTLFGEAFLNFGYVGIMFAAVFFGYVFRRLHLWVHSDMSDWREVLVKVMVAMIALRVLTNLVFTPGFFVVYILIGLYLGGVFGARMLEAARGHA